MDVTKYRERYEAQLAKAVTSTEKSAAAPLGEQNLDDQVADLLATLQNRDQPVASRTAALEGLAALAFLGPRFAPFRAAYKEALRDVVLSSSNAVFQRGGRSRDLPGRRQVRHPLTGRSRRRCVRL